MIKLFLASSFADVVALFVKSAQTELKGKTVTFIPTASIHEDVTFYVDASKKALQDLGLIIDILEISTATKNEISSKLESNDFIYVSGGNTFFLLKELRRTGADELIKEQINRGKPYIGESAGSVILSPNIEYVKEMDDFNAVPDLASFSSLGVIDFYPLPHYTNFPFQDSTQKIMSNYMDAINLIPFSNSQVILVDGDKVDLMDK